MQSISSVKDLKGKIAIVRVDFNIETAEHALRLEKSLPTIKYLISEGAKLLLISHRGRPEGNLDGFNPVGVTEETTLKFALPFLRENISSKVSFFSSFDFIKLKKEISNSEEGSIFVLENTRFHPGEKQNDNGFAKGLAEVGDIYVDDAFASAHREHVSVVGLPNYLPGYSGFLLEDEIKHLEHVMGQPKKPLVIIIGGGKTKEKFAVIKNLHEKVDKFLVGGVLANTFLKASGMDVKKSVVDDEMLEDVKEFLNDEKVEISSDWTFADNDKIMDISLFTVSRFKTFIESAGTIVWNGPLGVFEDPHYRKGSEEIAKAVSKSKAFSIVGGGETTQLILELGLETEFNFLSTGGGAMLHFLAGKQLPGIEAIK